MIHTLLAQGDCNCNSVQVYLLKIKSTLVFKACIFRIKFDLLLT